MKALLVLFVLALNGEAKVIDLGTIGSGASLLDQRFISEVSEHERQKVYRGHFNETRNNFEKMLKPSRHGNTMTSTQLKQEWAELVGEL